MIPISRPDVSDVEVEEVLSVLRTPFLSLGPKLREFEERMAGFLGVREAVAVSSGTAGLHLAVRAMGITEGMEVITTPFSFVASANVLLFEGAVPIFVDVDERTGNLTPETVEATVEEMYTRTERGLVNRRTGRVLGGLMPVDVFGHPFDIDGFRAVAQRHRLPLIEDACEALGSEVRTGRDGAWVQTGALADVAVFAFYPNKQMTTGEGGLIATNLEDVAAACRMGRNQGRAEGSAWLEHQVLGYNYRMDELSAALGVAQLRRFDELRRKRAAVARLYEEALGPIRALSLPVTEPWARVNWFVYVVQVAPHVDRDALQGFLAKRGIETRIYFPPIHLQPFYRTRFALTEGAFPVCEAISRRALALPFYNDLTREQVATIAAALHEGVDAYATGRP